MGMVVAHTKNEEERLFELRGSRVKASETLTQKGIRERRRRKNEFPGSLRMSVMCEKLQESAQDFLFSLWSALAAEMN